MDLSQLKLTLIGAGKMGGAMLQGWLAKGLSAKFAQVVDPGLPEDMKVLAKEYGFSLLSSADGLEETDILVIAVKPQMMAAILPGLVHLVGKETVILSVAAGTPIATFRTHFGENAHIVRAMPNTPCQVGRGMTAAFASDGIGEEMKIIVADLLSATGKFSWVDAERLIDAVTAISGSGPAYLFHMVEAMAKAGEALGLDRQTADLLARQTVIGAGELLHQSDLDATTLRKNVTSPGGTTAAALDVLMRDEAGLSSLMAEATEAARDRSVELSV